MNSSKQFLSRVSHGVKTTIPNYLMKKNTKNSVANTKKQPQASVSSVDLKDVGRQGLTLVTKVSVQNPYMVPIPICEIRFSLKSAGRVIVAGKVPDPGFLKANDTTLLDAPVKVPYSVLMSLAQDIGEDWDIDYVLDLGLIIDVPLIGNVTIPLSYKGQMKMPTLSDFFK
ncbi:hypothetical protein ACJIZ3_018498 [Penstemon smallii]|uniref:Water stress and hypersensitive response domain-containing protein n=1 Tax=Penstemon smallii TaxID=265156 RepID=A0ABD3SZ61_9LAMI